MATTLFTDGVTLIPASWLNDVDSVTYPLTATAGTNTITATGPNSLSAYASGQLFRFVPAATNTGATTINISNLGAKNVFWSGAAMIGRELTINVPALIYYDGTQFNLIGPTPYAVGTSTGTLTGCTTAPTYTLSYTRIGNTIILDVPATTATSNAVTKTITGLAAEARPATAKTFYGAISDNGGVYVASGITIGTNGTITLSATINANVPNTFTNSGTFASLGFSCAYTLV